MGVIMDSQNTILVFCFQADVSAQQKIPSLPSYIQYIVYNFTPGSSSIFQEKNSRVCFVQKSAGQDGLFACL